MPLAPVDRCLVFAHIVAEASAFTRETRIVEINTTGAAILGIEREQLLDSPFRHRVAPADLDSWDRYFASVLHDGDKQRCELRLKRADGSTFPARLLGRRSQTRGGATQVRIALDDISERRHLEAALHQNEDTLNALPAHIAVLDANGRIVLVNEAWQRFAARNGGLDHQIGIGNDYLAVCRHAIARDRDATAQAAIANLTDYVSTETLSTLQPRLLADADVRSIVELDDSTIEISLKR